MAATENQHIRRVPWLRVLVFAALAFAAYQPVWHAGFIWDDDDHLTANPAMTAPHGLRMIWTSLAVSRYYPLTLTSFWVQRRLWGLNPLPYHLVNVVIHAVNGLLFFFVLRRLRVSAALLAALVWLLHPVNVESVAWITELKNTQSALFFLCSILLFLQFEAQGQRHWYVLALLCATGAVLSKPSTVILPVVLLWCAWWERGRLQRSDLLRVAPFFALSLLISAWTIIEQRGEIVRKPGPQWPLGIEDRLIVAGKAIWFYLGKLLWPVDLVFVYPRWELVPNVLSSWVPLAGVGAVGFALWARRKQPWARAGMFGFGFFVTALLPVLGFFDVFYFRYSFVADHFQYLASLGLIACVASGIAHVLDRDKLWLTPPGNAICAALLLTLGGLTWRQSHVYHDAGTLWRDTVQKNPGAWIAHNNLGLALWQAGSPEEAIAQYGQSLQINPGNAEAHNNLGFAFAGLGRVQEAIGQYHQALQLIPDFAEAYNNLGNVLFQAGESGQAIVQYEQALRIDPDYAEAHYNLGNVLWQAGKSGEAIAQYEQALRANPDYVEALSNLGVASARLGRTREAMYYWERALQIKPDSPELHYNLGFVLEQTNNIQEAIVQYEQALKYRPDYAPAQDRLGRLRATR